MDTTEGFRGSTAGLDAEELGTCGWCGLGPTGVGEKHIGAVASWRRAVWISVSVWVYEGLGSILEFWLEDADASVDGLKRAVRFFSCLMLFFFNLEKTF